MKLGITASRKGLTRSQYEWMRGQIAKADGVHHGGCVGGDEASHHVAKELGKPITVHPPTDEKLMMEFTDWDFENCLWFPAADYHTRDREIVDNTDFLIALPDGIQRPHSGTWYTIGYATGENQVLTANRRIIPVLVCYPSGLIEGRGATKLSPGPEWEKQ